MSKLILFFALVFCADVVQAQTVVSSSAVNADNCGTVKFTDIRDGKVYSTVRIGTQCWMAEDLRFGKCDSVKFNTYHKNSVQNQIEEGYWGVCIGGKFPKEGHFYNWQAAMNSSGAAYDKEYESLKNSGGRDNALWQGICPEGWCLPSGGENGEFEKLTNISDYHALVGGSSSFKGTLTGFGLKTTIHNYGKFGYYWSSTHYNRLYGYSLFFDAERVNPRYYAASKSAGLVVRCIKIEPPASITAGTLNDLDIICAGTPATLKGTPAKGNGVVITSYEWFVDVDNTGFVVIPNESTDLLVYSSFEVGRSYVFKRKAICPLGEAEVESKSYAIPNTTIALSPTSVMIDDCGGATTVTATSAGSAYTWSYGGASLSTMNEYTPSRNDFSNQSGTFEVICSAIIGGCHSEAKLQVEVPNITIVNATDVTLANCEAVSFKDPRDGKVYCTRKIGNQCWMGVDLMFGTCDASAFSQHHQGTVQNEIASSYYGVCIASTQPGAGYLYNWQAAMNSADAVFNTSGNPSGNVNGHSPTQWQGICPDGWHLPSGGRAGEFQTMYTALGSVSAKVYPGLGGGEFRGVLGGCGIGASVYSPGSRVYYWSSTHYNTGHAYILSFNSGTVRPQVHDNAGLGFSVRCLKN